MLFMPALNRRGAALIIVLTTVLIVAILAAVILGLILSNARISEHNLSRTKAYYAALAGMNLAQDRLRIGAWGTGTYTICNTAGCGDDPVTKVEDPDIPYNVTIQIFDPGTADDGSGRKLNITVDY